MQGTTEHAEKMNFLPFELDYLTPEMVEKAKKELGETEEVRKAALKEMRKLLKEEKKLICPHDDEYLQQFLRARKYNVKRAFNVLQNYYRTKKQRTEVYSYDFAGFRNTMARNIFQLLPYRDDEGSSILIFKLEYWDYNERKINVGIHDLTLAVLFMLQYPPTQVCGIKAIFDMNKLSPAYLKAIHPKYLYLIANGVKNCLPMRLRGVHIINESFIFQYIWNIIKYVLNDKIRSRVHFHSNSLESLHKHISPDLLPVEYGGKYTYDTRRTLKMIDSQRNLYDSLLSYGYES